jgi:hypothetical protein
VYRYIYICKYIYIYIYIHVYPHNIPLVLDRVFASKVPWVYAGEVGLIILGDVIEGLRVGGPETDTGQV